MQLLTEEHADVSEKKMVIKLLSRHSLSSVQLASMAHCRYSSAPVVVHYSGNKLATTCGTTPYLGVN